MRLEKRKHGFHSLVLWRLNGLENFNGLEAELDFRYKIQDCVKFKNNLPDSISVTLKGVHSLAIPNINLALKLLSTLPITTFEYEKLFSSLPIVKSWDCSTVANARLNGSTLWFIHRSWCFWHNKFLGKQRDTV